MLQSIIPKHKDKSGPSSANSCGNSKSGLTVENVIVEVAEVVLAHLTVVEKVEKAKLVQVCLINQGNDNIS